MLPDVRTRVLGLLLRNYLKTIAGACPNPIGESRGGAPLWQGVWGMCPQIQKPLWVGGWE